MIRDFARLITLSVIMALVVAGAARPAQAFVDDVHGKEWRQLTETVGLSWDQVAQVCPQDRSEEHTSELQSHSDLVCRLLLEKKKKKTRKEKKNGKQDTMC